MQVKGKVVSTAVMAGAAAVMGMGTASAVAPIQWQSCEQLFHLEPGSIPPEMRMQCAQVDVPVDYADPDGRTTKVAVSKISAKNGQARGTVFGNPGGPGDDALMFWAPNPEGPNPEGLYNDYDLVAVQPRGLWGSNPIECNRDAIGPVSLNHLHDACYGTDPAYLRSMTTENAARDINAVREAMGEAQIDFYGVSYGTMIGADLATLYPNNVRRLVLDSNVGPHWNWAEQSARTSEAQRGRVYEMFQWIADHDAEYGLGDTPLKVYYNWKRITDGEVGGPANLIPPAAQTNDLPVELRGTPVEQPILDTVNHTAPARARVEGLVQAIALREYLNTGASGLFHATVGATYDEQAWPFIANVMRAYNTGTPVPQVSLANAAKIREARQWGPPLNTAGGMFHIVTCNENTTPVDPIGVIAADIDARTGGDVMLAEAAGARAGADCFGYAPVARPIEPNGDALAQTPLVLQNWHDAVTPIQGGFDMAEAFDAPLIGVPNGGHGVFRTGNKFVDDAVLAFLDNGQLPPVTLPGRPEPKPLPTTLDAPLENNRLVGYDLHGEPGKQLYVPTQVKQELDLGAQAAQTAGQDAAAQAAAPAAAEPTAADAASQGYDAGAADDWYGTDPVRTAVEDAASQIDDLATQLTGVDQTGAQDAVNALG